MHTAQAHRLPPVIEAAGKLTYRGFTAMPVVNEAGELIGIVTEADLIRNRFRDEPSASQGATVGEVMTSRDRCQP